jgi:hypothetical protein
MWYIHVLEYYSTIKKGCSDDTCYNTNCKNIQKKSDTTNEHRVYDSFIKRKIPLLAIKYRALSQTPVLTKKKKGKFLRPIKFRRTYLSKT